MKCIIIPARLQIDLQECLKGQDGTVDAVHATVAGGNEVVFGPEAHHVNNLNEEMVATPDGSGS
jgi:hypothetical protein